MDLISQEKLEHMTSMEKIRLILDKVKTGRIVVLESGLTPDEGPLDRDDHDGRSGWTSSPASRSRATQAVREQLLPGSDLGQGIQAQDDGYRACQPASELWRKGQYQISTKVSVGD